MNQFKLLLILFLVTIQPPILSQNDTNVSACCAKDYNSFNFWLDEWEVFDQKGKLVETNSITKIYDNCLLQEDWISKGKNRGTSYNFYNKKDKTWNKVCIDKSGFV